jgi:hypothetical protein
MRFEGVLHLGSTDSVDRFTLTRRAAGLMGFDEALVVAQKPGPAVPDGSPVPARAARHRRGVISVNKARRLLATPMLDWETSLRRAVEGRPTNGR